MYVNALAVIRQYFIDIYFKKKLKKNFMTPFYGWTSTASRLEPLQGGSLLFTTKFPEIPGTHFIDLGRMKELVDHEAIHSTQSSPLNVCIPLRIMTKYCK